jgi:hypothetical protein
VRVERRMYVRHYGLYNSLPVNKNLSQFIHYFSGGQIAGSRVQSAQCLTEFLPTILT